ncbi:MAG: hypothetical protein FJY29_00795 [Betaproteobacteria bacterium]|nr:hypothetical protein [Betaproteobacteria bacterium]
MKRNSVLSCIKIVLAGLVLPTLLSSSCGRAPVEYLDETVGTVEVTGAFADWTPGTSSFAGGRFILLDAATNEVFSSAEISATQRSFKIESVPVSGRYYGILIDSRFEPRAYIEKKLGDEKRQRIFKLNNTLGKLGTIVVRDQAMEPSQHADLEFQTNIGVMGVNKPYEKDFNTNIVFNPDIDEDGTPNVIDTNFDGDDIPNIFDAFSYKAGAIPDSAIGWQFNQAFGIPKTGFFKCNYLRSPKAPTDSPEVYKLNFSCMLKLPVGLAQSVELATVKTFLENAEPRDQNSLSQKMKDDGSGGDLIASDGIWTSQFSVSENSTEVFKGQLIFANVKLSTGSQKTFVTQLEPKSILTLANLIQPVCSQDKKTLEFGLKKESLDSIKADIKDFLLTMTLKTASGEDISATPPLLRLSKDSSEKYKFSVDENSIKLSDTVPTTYYPLIRVTAPSALPGILGSAFELYLPLVKFTYDPSQDSKITIDCI